MSFTKPQIFFTLSLNFFLITFNSILAQDEDFSQKRDRDPMAEYIANAPLSPLEKAILSQDFKLVKTLVEKKAEINPKDTSKGFPLMYAVIANNPGIVEYLLSNGAKVESIMSKGVTPLMMAVHWNLIEVVKVLLKYKANINIKMDGVSLLDVATQSQYYELRLLLAKEMGVDLTTSSSTSTLPVTNEIPDKN